MNPQPLQPWIPVSWHGTPGEMNTNASVAFLAWFLVEISHQWYCSANSCGYGNLSAGDFSVCLDPWIKYICKVSLNCNYTVCRIELSYVDQTDTLSKQELAFLIYQSWNTNAEMTDLISPTIHRTGLNERSTYPSKSKEPLSKPLLPYMLNAYVLILKCWEILSLYSEDSVIHLNGNVPFWHVFFQERNEWALTGLDFDGFASIFLQYPFTCRIRL